MAKLKASHIAEIYKILAEGATTEQVAKHCDLHLGTVYTYIREWHLQGIIYVADWTSPPHKEGKKPMGRKVAVYQLSHPIGKKDVLYPKKSRAEIVATGKVRALAKQLELIASAKSPAAELKKKIREIKSTGALL